MACLASSSVSGSSSSSYVSTRSFKALLTSLTSLQAYCNISGFVVVNSLVSLGHSSLIVSVRSFNNFLALASGSWQVLARDA